MIIVIDAYNLLHSLNLYAKKITEQARNRFITQLGKYGKHKGNKIVLVFDGGQSDWPYQEQVHGVCVVYSGVQESADDYIKEYLTKQRSKDLLLVSSDSELRNYAVRLGISVLRVHEFWPIMQETMLQAQPSDRKAAAQSAPVKMIESNSAEIDKLMVQASTVVPLKSEDIIFDSSGVVVKHTPSKKERKLLKKLKKL